jgi:cell division protein FtsQ
MTVQIGTRRSTFNRPRRVTVLRVWLGRFGFLFGGVLLLGWFGAWMYLSGGFTRAADWGFQKTYEITSNMGFRVENILVEGRVNADPDTLLGIVNKQKGSPIFSFDPGAAREQIEQVSWIKSARVERRLPDTIFIRLEERQPLALWQHEDKLAVIDDEGQILSERSLSRFKELVIVTGKDAPAKTPELLELIAAAPVLQERIESAAWIGGRRWDLKLEEGTLVRLPEEDIGLALSELSKAQEKDGLLDKDITAIDLRDPARMIVRTREGAGTEYKADDGSI